MHMELTGNVGNGDLNTNAAQKSFNATWHSSNKASAKSRNLNVKANFGYCGVADHDEP